ncbi:hypothetical protein CMUST_09620 [Corynebacterium mustelae]|uniref:Uncharacterized protein n=1 Tax=Corynebacterium mustelae TaxID=571915 RepID=A0A0G3H0G3_9CORY|nr:hypothetical protein [Corynebacterium mustelae]AKK06240.1 hypothetical protein CMUST_09620 [Corynebacterium mustelae]
MTLHTRPFPSSPPDSAATLIAWAANHLHTLYGSNCGFEQFLAHTVALHHRDPGGLLNAVRKTAPFHLPWEWMDWAYDSLTWTRAIRDHDVVEARTRAVLCHLDAVPVLLSEPSFTDLSVSLSDLLRRLKVYEERTLPVLEPDFVLALTRLREAATRTELCDRLVEQCYQIGVPILLDTGRECERLAGAVLAEYLCDPHQQQRDVDNPYLGLKHPHSLRGLPDRVGKYAPYKHTFEPTMFPLWAEAIHVSIPVRSADFVEDISGTEEDVVALFNQIAESSQPLSPRAQAKILVCSAGVADYFDMIPVLEIMWQRRLFQPIGQDFPWPTSDPDFLTTRELRSFLERLCTTQLRSVAESALQSAAHFSP